MTIPRDSTAMGPMAGAVITGGGRMGELMREFDWSRTPIGAPDTWPQSLRTAVSILLESRFPKYIAWGPEFVEFYNDAFRPILGTKHPGALGGSSRETWSEIWGDFVGPLFAKVRDQGEATYLEDTLVSLYRYGYTEECYFTFCYSAIRDESGDVGGVLVTCIETTARVVSERRLRTLRELGARAGDARTQTEACRIAASVMSANVYDLPFGAIYLADDDGRTARLAGVSGADVGQPPWPDAVRLTKRPGTSWPLTELAESDDTQVIAASEHDAARLSGGAWPEPATHWAVTTIRGRVDGRVAAFVVAGLSPRRALDDEYRGFLELLSGHIGRAVANARAHEEERTLAAARERAARENARLLDEAKAAKAALEAKAEELQLTAAELEMQSEELRATTDELQELNQRLSANEERLRLANTTAGIGTWEFDLATGRFVCDDQCRSVLGLSSGPLSYDDMPNAALADDRAGLRDVLMRAYVPPDGADHADFETEFRLATSGGAVRWASLTGRAVFGSGDDGHRLIRIVGTVHDITSRRHAENALREEAQIIETIHRVGSALMSDLDLASVVQAVTDEVTKLTGAQFGAFFYNVASETGESYTLYTISGVPREAFSRFPMPRNTAVFEPTFRGTGIVRSDDITRDERYGRNPPHWGMPRGHLPVVSYLAVPVVSRAGDVLGGLFLGHEKRAVFTERHERVVVGVAAWAAVAIDNARLYERERRARTDAEGARVDAEHANRAKTEFLATMSHELRTPLNAIAGYVDLLEMGIRGPVTAQQGEDLRRIKRSQQHLLTLINDILNFAKIEAGQVELHLSNVSVAGLLTDIEQIIAPQLSAKTIAYDGADCDESLAVRADAEKVRQILLNLLANAVKFTQPGGRVALRCDARESVIELSIADTGRGIPADKLDSIFEPFVQVDRHLTAAGNQGIGLGLAISRDLARAMGGDILVTSRVGSGSTFTLSLLRA